MQVLLQNIRFSLRMLARNPGMTLNILLTLAIGIGANTAIFTVVYATLLAPLPYPQPDQLVMVWSSSQTYNHASVTAANFLDWKRQNAVFEDLCASSGTNFNLATKDNPEFVPGDRASYNMLQMIGEPLFMGRYFLPEEGIAGREHVVIITHKLWMRLGSDPNIIGTTLRLNDDPYTVVGVLRPGIDDRKETQLIVPLVFRPEQLTRDFPWLLVMGRLKPGVTVEQAQQNMNAITAHIAEVYPKSNKGWGANVERLKNNFLPKEQIRMLWLLLGAVGFVLIIACVNAANLLLARGLARQKELAVRSSLGAGRTTIFAQLLTEGMVLALAGGAMGIGVGYAMLQGLVAAMPPDALPSEADLRLNIPILLFTLLVTTITGLLAGSAPAWYASRVDPAEVLKDGGSSGTSAGNHFLLRILVIGEFALALALLAGAGLTIHSFWNLAHVDLGIKTDHVLTFFLPVPETRSKDPQVVTSYYRDILSHIEAVPGVQHSAAMTGGPPYGGGFGMRFMIEDGQSHAPPSHQPNIDFGMVTPDYLQTFGIQLISGRAFTDQDTASTIKVAMVNQNFVRKYLKGKDPLRQRVLVEQLFPGTPKLGGYIPWQIVGVFHNVHTADQRDEIPQMLVPFYQSPWLWANFGVRTAEPPSAMLVSVSAAVHQVDPTISLAYPKTLEEKVDESIANQRFELILFSSFAGVALFLAGFGIYGVMSFSVTRRAHEIALRMALGATHSGVVNLIIREGVLLSAIGLGLGLVCAYFVSRAMQSLLFGVRALDFATFMSASAVLLVTAILACILPARRAASVPPMRVLRSE